ncbi:MAG: hypothetical protein LC749_05850, partial [Actinobacteria bacterium]|nr:hypothetical protein [Actinomycetota bacterium]
SPHPGGCGVVIVGGRSSGAFLVLFPLVDNAVACVTAIALARARAGQPGAVFLTAVPKLLTQNQMFGQPTGPRPESAVPIYISWYINGCG